MSKSAKPVALLDRVSWMIVSDDPRRPHQHVTVSYGEEVDAPAEELDRLRAIGAIGDGTDLEAAQVSRESKVASMSDEELLGLDYRELISYVEAHPDQAERVGALEVANRGAKARPSIMQAVQSTVEAVGARLEEAEARSEQAQEPAPAAPPAE